MPHPRHETIFRLCHSLACLWHTCFVFITVYPILRISFFTVLIKDPTIFSLQTLVMLQCKLAENKVPLTGYSTLWRVFTTSYWFQLSPTHCQLVPNVWVTALMVYVTYETCGVWWSNHHYFYSVCHAEHIQCWRVVIFQSWGFKTHIHSSCLILFPFPSK